MNISVIAIGNRMMGDDAVAIYAAERLQEELARLGIDVVLGETDVDFCLDKVKSCDELIIIDSSCSGEALGSTSSIPLQRAFEYSAAAGWQHDRDLIGEMKIRDIRVPGLLLYIEATDIDFRWGLSPELQQKLPQICSEIQDIILKYRGESKNA